MRDEETLDSTEQRLLHGLLSDLHDSSREARARLLMKEIDPSRPRVMARVAAALAFMAIGAAAGILLQSRLPEAQAVIDRASEEARNATDRQYRVVVQALKGRGPESVATGMLHVRGAEAFAIQFEAFFGKGWYGSDGRRTWFQPAQGQAIAWDNPEEARWKERDKLEFVRFESFLRSFKDRFDIATLGRQDGLLRVRATRRIDLPAEVISQFDIWVSEKTGVMMKLQYRMDPELWHWEPWLVTIEYAGNSAHSDDFYSFESNSR